MNSNKICFISCVNDQELYYEALYYINQLHVPEGYEIECISVENADSMTQGYNDAMKNSDAKYKVYLHQDVYIRNKSFVKDILDVFKSNNEIGMIGMAGAKNLPTNGIWWESQQKYGEVYDSHTGKMELLKFKDIYDSNEIVQVVDGLIMITQYDIPWREDIFDGWHFYDISQSIEFDKSGYKVVIPEQDEPWIIHDCGIVNFKNGYEYYRQIFLEEYSKYMFPLVSILIPTYNRPEYFELALKSALNQTYKNIEIIIGDDSTNSKTEDLVKDKYLNRFENIQYYHNQKNIGQFENDLKLYEMSNGKYINYLMDDDIFEVTKIEKMMNYFIQDYNKEISLITSHRGIINENGEYKGIFGNNDKIFKKDTLIDGVELGNQLIINYNNFIGEPTTVLFNKRKLKESFGVFNGRVYGPNVDQASWLNLLSEGKAVYINEVLSYFRFHKGQQQHNDEIIFQGYIDHAHKLLTCRDKKFMENDRDYTTAIEKFIKMYNQFKYNNINIKKNLDYKEFQKYYCKLEEIINNNNEKILPLVSILIPTYNQTKYLKKALDSAINQTYPNIEIIIGDDSTNKKVKEFLEPYLKRYKNISYFKNHRNKIDYGFSNVTKLLEKSNGEYINYLFHDDIFHITKIEKMMEYYLSRDDISLVTSHRQLINEEGEFLLDSAATKRIFDEDTCISGKELGVVCLESITNFIGEPSTVLFKKSMLKQGFGYFNNNRYVNLGDMAMWLSLLQKEKVVYIYESLSYFRQHESQNSQKKEVYLTGVYEWKKIIDDSYEVGFIKDRSIYRKLISKWFNTFNLILKNTGLLDIDYTLKNRLSETFKDAIDIILESIDDFKKCVICESEVDKFLPYNASIPKSVEKLDIIGSDIDNFSCPKCYSHDRERHLKMYFDKLNLWENFKNKRILHIAPENNFSELIKEKKPIEYIKGDLYPAKSDTKKLDITDTNFKEEYFDVIICNHVLEHIENDKKAMYELYRVLKRGGYAILQTPYSPKIYKSFEDKHIESDEQRLENYGQEDHVRVYGLDLFERLESVGFKLNIISNNTLFSTEDCKKYGVNSKEDLILVSKN